MPAHLSRAVVAGLALLVCTPSGARAGDLRVMTRNLYLGADLMPLLTAPTPAQALVAAGTAFEQIAASNFPERAGALAEEIAKRRPHLVGLQEVFAFTLNGSTGPVPFRDYLTDLLDALAAHGAAYAVAGVVENLAFAVDFPGLGTIGVVDRDVILARSDVPTSVVRPGKLCPKPSADGCNYQFVLEIPTPFGVTLPVERGFVVVDATVDGRALRFATTHLEIKDGADPASGVFQFAQAVQLLVTLARLPAPAGVTIVAGDLNSSPEDPVTVVGPLNIVPPYLQFLTAGYIDVWVLHPGEPPGFTCCQLPDLSNPTSVASERIDLVFSSTTPLRVSARLTGNTPLDEAHPSIRWPSDHAGVMAALDLPGP
jgi:endonuclease/exonuclease/phosphatase family metal-dependent hydrolase